MPISRARTASLLGGGMRSSSLSKSPGPTIDTVKCDNSSDSSDSSSSLSSSHESYWRAYLRFMLGGGNNETGGVATFALDESDGGAGNATAFLGDDEMGRAVALDDANSDMGGAAALRGGNIGTGGTAAFGSGSDTTGCATLDDGSGGTDGAAMLALTGSNDKAGGATALSGDQIVGGTAALADGNGGTDGAASLGGVSDDTRRTRPDTSISSVNGLFICVDT